MKPTTIAIVMISAPALAQNPILRVLSAGDATPIGNVTTIDNLALGRDGAWYIECDTNHANTALDQIVLSRNGIFQREGDPMSAPVGASLGSFDALSAPLGGRVAQNLFLDGTLGTNDDSGVYWNNQLTIQEGLVSSSPVFSAGTPYIGFFEVKANVNNQILVVASIDDPAIATTVDRALVIATVDNAGALLSETVIAKEGDVLAGQTDTVADFGTGPHNFAFNDSGSALFFADLNGSTATDGVIYLDNSLIAQEGSASPIAGRNWLTLSSSRMALNNFGAWVHTGTLDGDVTSDLVIMSSSGKIAQEGDPVPNMAPFVFTGFGSGAVHIGDNGDVYWYAEWNDVSTQNAGWFRNQTKIVQEGFNIVGGQLLTGLAAGQDNSSLSPSGTGLLFEGTLATSGNSAMLYDGTPGSFTYCTAKANSQGCLPDIWWSGVPSPSQTSGFTVFSMNTMNNKNGLLFYGINGQAAMAFQGGTLCVAPPIKRTPSVNSLGDPPPNNCSGVFTIDMNAFAAGLGGGTPLPDLLLSGTTVNCQFWGRDPGFVAPNNTSLSLALEYIVGY